MQRSVHRLYSVQRSLSSVRERRAVGDSHTGSGVLGLLRALRVDERAGHRAESVSPLSMCRCWCTVPTLLTLLCVDVPSRCV